MIDALKKTLEYLSENPKKHLLVISDSAYQGIIGEKTSIKKYLNENKIPYLTKFRDWNIYLDNESVIIFEQLKNINSDRLRGYLFDVIYISEELNTNPMEIYNAISECFMRLNKSGKVYDYKANVLE